MVREVPDMPGVVELDDADLTPEEQALIARAEAGNFHFDPATILRGDEAMTSGYALLEAAFGGSEHLDRALGGRPTLDPAGGPSKVRQVRLSMPMSDRLDEVAKAQDRKPSEIMRDALQRYLEAC